MLSSAIDDLDRKILGVLRLQGRITFRELGGLINLSPNATAERVMRLQEQGVITGFEAKVSYEALGLSLQAFIDLKLRPDMSVEAFERNLHRFEAIHDAVSLTGPFDVRVRVVCQDTQHLGKLIEHLRSVAGVLETNSTVICRALSMRKL